jgi:hypothetical protein
MARAPSVGASILAMVINDDAWQQAELRDLETIASRLAPTVDQRYPIPNEIYR